MEQIPFGTSDVPFGTNDFAENTEPRVPCVLVLDVSGSMQGIPIRQLNDGLQAFKDALSSDSLAAKRVEVAIITFGAEVEVVCDFTTTEGFQPPMLRASGMTPMGQAVDKAMEMIEQRKRTYKSNSISYYRPWIFLITDGGPNDPGWEGVARRSREQDQAKAFALFAVGVDEANFEKLGLFTPREPVRLRENEWRKMFLWLSSSLKSVSRSTPGEDVPLDNPTAPGGWGSI
jgi:uncharacterized protein YegL